MSEHIEICGSRGPRIGSEGQPICKGKPGHQGEHRPALDDGWGESMSWTDPWRDPSPVTAAVPLVERLAEALAGHDDPPGWMWSDSDQMVYACECGGHYVAGPIDVIQEHDVLAAAAWHRAHVARALLPVVEQAVAEARGEALWQATNDWQWGQWTVLTEPIKAEAQPQRIIGAAQAVTDWLRERAKASTKETS